MSETTQQLVQAIVQKDALAIEAAFNLAMAEKVASKLDDMRDQVAQTMFASETEEE
jgi:hypothetical protein